MKRLFQRNADLVFHILALARSRRPRLLAESAKATGLTAAAKQRLKKVATPARPAKHLLKLCRADSAVCLSSAPWAPAAGVGLLLPLRPVKISRLAAGALGKVRIDPELLAAAPYAPQLSGGQCQRAMIAAALACGPRLRIAEEPTSALEVTLQAQVMVSRRERCRQEIGRAQV